MPLHTVRVPEPYEALFETAESVVSGYFSERTHSPDQGTIEISGERYLLVRAASLSVEFHGLVAELYGAGREEEAESFAQNLLYDLAHALGRSDAQAFHTKMGLSDPIARLSAGPVHFAHAGWAWVDISPESSPTADDDFFLLYDHPYSFEADSWIRAGTTRTTPACVMNAGYSAGWCQASFGVVLVASEVSCRASGDEHCRFVMAHPSQIERHFNRAAQRMPAPPRGRQGSLPNLFARKRLEEELRRHRDELEVRVAERTAELQASNERLRSEMAEREEVEKRLRQTHKLEALGRLAGGIAHDFNNLMGVIMGHSSMMQSRLAPEDALQVQVTEITQACARAANLTQQLLAFSRSQLLAREALDLNVVVSELGQMLERLIGEDIQLELHLSPAPVFVSADRGQLEQVIVNLLVNGRDAMPEGGVLEVEVAQVEVAQAEVDDAAKGNEWRGVPPGAYGSLRVTDHGVGMDEETLRRVFDPFFTTKEEGKGTGLGLSTVYGIVEQSQGHVTVRSAPAEGATFSVFFPLIAR